MADKPKVRIPRTTRRVEDSGKSTGAATKNAQHRAAKFNGGVPDGMIEITAQASELVPVAQYANVTIGPVAVRRLVPDTGDLDDLKDHIRETQEVIYEIIAEDREAVEESVRAYNQRQAEEEAQKSKQRR